MTLRFLIALLSAYVFFRGLDCGEMASLFGAAAWAFSDFLVFFLGWGNSAAVAPFPLLLLAARNLVHAPGRRSVVLAVVASVLALTGGHPETALHAGAGAGLYFFFELARAGRGRRWRPIGLAVLGAVLSLGLCAVLLLPLAETMSQSLEHFDRLNWYAHTKRSLPVGENLRRLRRSSCRTRWAFPAGAS